MFQIQEKQDSNFQFEYKGKAYSIPAPNAMTVADAMKVSKMAKDNDTAGLLDFMLELVNGETDGLGNEMTLDEFTQLVDAWKESGDTPLGK